MSGRPAPDLPGSAQEAATWVREVRSGRRRSEELIPLLAEESPIYAGMGSGEADRLRGHILASFAWSDVPEAALPYILEELETGRNPFTVAAAAHAVRAAAPPPAEAAALVESAIRRIRGRNQPVDFERLLPSPAHAGGRTALGELEQAQAELQARPCCAHIGKASAPALPADAPRLGEIEVQDQDGEILALGNLVGGRAALLTGFYTRCTNPQKCSLTISKLGRLWNLVEAAGLAGQVAVAGVSYDPEFDLPARLHDYGAARNLRFSANLRLLRTTGPFEPLRQRLAFGVGYGDATVNRHRLDLILLNPDGTLAEYRTRRLWDERDVFDRLAAAAPPPLGG
ncbi:MAG TPA: SCO family protein [Sphingomicrobium sp.]